MEERRAEVVLAFECGQVRLRGDSRSHDELLRLDGGFNTAGVYSQEPGIVGPMLGATNAGTQVNAVAELEVLRILLEIILEDVARDMFTGLDSKRDLVHWEVAELVGSQHIV